MDCRYYLLPFLPSKAAPGPASLESWNVAQSERATRVSFFIFSPKCSANAFRPGPLSDPGIPSVGRDGVQCTNVPNQTTITKFTCTHLQLRVWMFPSWSKSPRLKSSEILRIHPLSKPFCWKFKISGPQLVVCIQEILRNRRAHGSKLSKGTEP